MCASANRQLRSPRPIYLLLAVLPLAVNPAAHAAAKPPVQWHVKTVPAKAVKAGAKFTVSINYQIDSGWHLYALEEPQDGPVATEIALTDGGPADTR
jgi:hypothetical protein